MFGVRYNDATSENLGVVIIRMGGLTGIWCASTLHKVDYEICRAEGRKLEPGMTI